MAGVMGVDDTVIVPKFQTGQPLTVACWVDGGGMPYDVYSYAQVQQAGSADAQTTQILLISACCYSELHSAITSYSGVQYLLTKVH